MTTSRLPEIVLTCRNGHQFPTKARSGATVRCKTCGAPKRVPADRPKTAREVAALAAEREDQDPARELAARWAVEPEWDGRQLDDWPGRPADRCLECGGPLTWEPGRTWTNCDACAEGDGGVSLPAAVIAFYERRAEVATRSAGTVATREDPAAEQAARVRLRALQAGARNRVESWLDTIADPDSYDRVQYQRQARELAAMLNAWLPEINAARDESALAATWQQIDALITGEQGKALSVEYEQAQARAQQQYEARQYAIEYEQQQRELAEQQERERKESERAAREAELEQARQRKAIAGKATSYGPQTQAMAQLAYMIKQGQDAKARKIAEQGECDSKHWTQVVATRLYGVPFRDYAGNMNGLALANTPQYRACSKHYDATVARLNREGYPDTCYWDLPLRQSAGDTSPGYTHNPWGVGGGYAY